MKRRKRNDLLSLVQSFFGNYLERVRGASANTIRAYRDTLKLFFLFPLVTRRCPLHWRVARPISSPEMGLRNLRVYHFHMQPTVIILSFNSEDSLGATVASARRVSEEIFVVDSFSNDGTVELARSLGVTVVQHPFENYGAQRNWAIENLPISRPWQLHLDADERMDDRLVSAIYALPENPEHSGYFLPRYVRFLGRVLRHGGMSPTWHLRLFRSGVGRCEDRRYDQHFLLMSGSTGWLCGMMIDDIRMPLTEWTTRHNRWADSEVAELESGESVGRLTPDAFGNPAQRKRFLRRHYNRMPLFGRPFLLFFYRYFFRFGFLDGTEGFIFWVLQTFWFRFLVDAKIWESRHKSRLRADLSRGRPQPYDSASSPGSAAKGSRSLIPK